MIKWFTKKVIQFLQRLGDFLESCSEWAHDWKELLQDKSTEPPPPVEYMVILDIETLFIYRFKKKSILPHGYRVIFYSVPEMYNDLPIKQSMSETMDGHLKSYYLSSHRKQLERPDSERILSCADPDAVVGINYGRSLLSQKNAQIKAEGGEKNGNEKS